VRTLVAGTIVLSLLLPAVCEAQKSPPRVHRIGILMQTTPVAAAHIGGAFIEGLRELGHVEGRDVVFEYRWAEGKIERFPDLAGELVRMKVDLIVASSISAAEAAYGATRTIPIVMVNAAEPVEAGLVKSLARPGGNVTGLSGQLTAEIRAKQVQLLKEAVPGLARAVILRRTAVADAAVWKEYEDGARTLEVKVQFANVGGPEDLARVIGAVSRERTGVIVPGDPVFFTERQRLVALTLEHRLPTMFYAREFTVAGGLMSYSAKLTDQFRRAAVYVDKILRGQSPATLPVERPTEFELVVNVKTARLLKLTLPQSLLIRAAEVIQ
jgi:putative tryptophan/tyrosine transport system substrate-binding protein